MSIVSLVLALLKLANLGVSYLQQRNLMDAGTTAAINEQLVKGMALVKVAQDIRNSTTADNVGAQLDLLHEPNKRKQ